MGQTLSCWSPVWGLVATPSHKCGSNIVTQPGDAGTQQQLPCPVWPRGNCLSSIPFHHPKPRLVAPSFWSRRSVSIMKSQTTSRHVSRLPNCVGDKGILLGPLSQHPCCSYYRARWEVRVCNIIPKVNQEITVCNSIPKLNQEITV